MYVFTLNNVRKRYTKTYAWQIENSFPQDNFNKRTISCHFFHDHAWISTIAHHCLDHWRSPRFKFHYKSLHLQLENRITQEGIKVAFCQLLLSWFMINGCVMNSRKCSTILKKLQTLALNKLLNWSINCDVFYAFRQYSSNRTALQTFKGSQKNQNTHKTKTHFPIVRWIGYIVRRILSALQRFKSTLLPDLDFSKQT